MAIPDYQTVMLPLLKFAADEQEHTIGEAAEALAKEFALTEEERRTLLPSGIQTTLVNRVSWAKIYLQKAGLLDATRRRFFRISERGRSVLAKNPPRISRADLMQFPEFRQFQTKHSEREADRAAENGAGQQTPQELFENTYEQLREEMIADLLERIKKCTPRFFEKLVIDVLLKMGYGGYREQAGEVVGRGGDGGIDGIINQDRLGLDSIYLQAKRWEGTVGRPLIQQFVGALHGRQAKKGVFITTSVFTSEAKEYASKIDPKVVLIGGRQLAAFMIDFNVGVSPGTIYELKKLDSDYFEE